MNITFLIGNGFDLNLGLKTAYLDFYQEYDKRNNSDVISQAIRGKTINYWADLELLLGQVANQVKTNEDLSAFLDAKSIVERALIEYLEKEEKALTVNDPGALAKELRTNIQNIPQEFSETERTAFLNILANCPQTAKYQFVSFNYTNSLDTIVNTAIKSNEMQAPSHEYARSRFNDVLEPVFHVHGTLSDHLIMGVADSSQINNPAFSSNPDLTNYLVKKETNDGLGNRRIESVQKLIDDSQIVLIYGLSLGASDKYWWGYLLSWLTQPGSRCLVIYYHDKETAKALGTEDYRRTMNLKKQFLTVAGQKGKISSEFLRRIFIVTNSQIFTFSNAQTALKDKASSDYLSAFKKASVK